MFDLLGDFGKVIYAIILVLLAILAVMAVIAIIWGIFLIYKYLCKVQAEIIAEKIAEVLDERGIGNKQA